MLSVIMSGLNVAQKDLEVASNNVANASTVGFKRSTASFQDVFSNDPSANPKTSVGSGAITSLVSRSTSQGSMSSTDKVTDLAIAGRGYFTLASTDPDTGARNVVYTRAGNFSVNVNGEIVDASDNQLQVFQTTNGKVNTTAPLVGAKISAEKDPADVRVPLTETASVGAQVTVNLGSNVLVQKTLTQADVDAGYVTVSAPGVSSDNSADLSASYQVATVRVAWTTAAGATAPVAGDQVRFTGQNGFVKTVTLTAADVAAGFVNVEAPANNNATIAQATADFLSGGVQMANITPAMTSAITAHAAASEYRGVYLQGISIDSKGLITATYGDGSKTDVGAIALASFRNDSALKPIGNTKFISSDASGQALMTRAGAPFAGDILSGTLEQANVDITQELMTMLKAQQLYNGNARMLQTAVEVGSRITDKL